MSDKGKSAVLTTEEACDCLGISRSTYFKYLVAGNIKGIKAGRGWKVLKSELDRFVKGTTEIKSSEMSTQKSMPKSAPKMQKTILRSRLVKKTRMRNCLKCGHQVILEKGFFLCEPCRKANSLLEDMGSVYQSHLTEAVRTFRLGQMSTGF